MSGYTKKNLRTDVENQAPKFGMPGEMQARFARSALEGSKPARTASSTWPSAQETIHADAELVPSWWSD
jgi:hypothetical protein